MGKINHRRSSSLLPSREALGHRSELVTPSQEICTLKKRTWMSVSGTSTLVAPVTYRIKPLGHPALNVIGGLESSPGSGARIPKQALLDPLIIRDTEANKT